MNAFYSLCVLIVLLTSTSLGQRPARRPSKPQPATTSASRKLSPEELAKYALPSVPLVVCSDGDSISQASGFFTGSGLLVTNYHVIRGMTRGSVRIEVMKQKFDMAITRVLYYDEPLDLAFLWVPDAVAFKIPSLKLINEDDIQVGETVYALGNPEGLTGTFSPGIVSAQERRLRDISYLQISAPVSHGSSGGPVINSRGEVIGVVVGSIEEGQNLNFAIAAKYVRGMMNQVSNALQEAVGPTSPNGEWSWSKTPPEIRAKELVAKGDVQVGDSQLSEALNSYLEALRLSPGLREARRGVGNVYDEQASPLIKEHKYSDALRLLRQSIETYPDNDMAQLDLGRVYALTNQDTIALEAYDRALKLNPDFDLAHYAKGLSLVSLRKFESAMEEVSALKRLNSKLANDLLDLIGKDMLTSNLAILRQELEAQGQFSRPLQSGSVSASEMTFFVPLSFANCKISWRQSTARIFTNYSAAAMTAQYTDYELNLKDLDPERIRLDQANEGRYYIYLPTADGRTSIKRTSFLSYPDTKGKQKESKSTEDTSRALINIKSDSGANELIKTFKESANICRLLSTSIK